MNNWQIDNLLHSHLKTKNIFTGVYPYDVLPPYKDIIKPSAFIINTDPHYKRGEHWIAIYFPSHGLPELFDSYGFSILIPELKTFIGNSAYRYNNKLIQNNFSSVCGQYCIYFIYCRSIGKSLNSIVNSFSGDKISNDEYVNYAVETIFNINLPIYNIPFMTRQISVVLKNSQYFQKNQ